MDLERLNSLTKYPSIPTYHAMGDGGRLVEQITRDLGDDIVVTEKIDGTNARIVVLGGGDWLIGSREDWLHARGDRIWRNDNNIVDVVRPYAERAASHAPCVLYGEVYGGRINGARAYTQSSAGGFGFRLFDHVDLEESLAATEGMTREQISTWRDIVGPRWCSMDLLEHDASELGVGVVPYRQAPFQSLPRDIEGAAAWLRAVIDKTAAALPGATPGGAEGVVVRSADNQVRVKLRFEDYERTLRRR